MSFDPIEILSACVRKAIATAVPEVRDADAMIAASKNPKFGDFQCNAAMALGKQVGKPPREVAARIVEHLKQDAAFNALAEPLSEASIAGPGFINIMLKAGALPGLLGRLDSPTLGFENPPMDQRPVCVVDLCGVNLAKQMHVGHLRAIIIGDTLARVLEKAGWKVIRQNHVGDWGLPIAMVTARLMEAEREGRLNLADVTLDDLDKAYRAAQRECDADEKGLAIARKWHMGDKIVAELQAQVDGAKEKMLQAKSVLGRLQNREPEVMRVWQRISDVTMSACLAICKRLNAIVGLEHSAGESSYAGVLGEVVAHVERCGVSEVSEGALIVRLDAEGIAEPLIVRKSDGAYLYATTDLAAIRHRVRNLGASRVVYCVDARQSLHFRQVFAGAKRIGFAELSSQALRTLARADALGRRAEDGRNATLEHAAFGTILGDDGRPFKTRSGENVKMTDMLDQAEAFALEAVASRGEIADAAERRAIAQAVAVAAIRYVDLSTERIKDYVFSYQRMLSYEGNTGPYLLYAVARVRSIFRKAAERGMMPAQGMAGVDAADLRIAEPAEKSLALSLLRYPAAVGDVARTLEPSKLCAYLYELAGAFSSFFDACPVLAAPDEATRLSRLRLCRVTERVLVDGLGLLGIPTLERM